MAFNPISVNEFNTNSSISSIADSLQDIIKNGFASGVDMQKDANEEINDINELFIRKEIKDREESTEKQAKTFSETFKSIFAEGNKVWGNLVKQFESSLNEYVKTYQNISYNLIGSGMTYATVREALAVLGTNAFVRQTEVYNNLNKLVSSGLTYNATQRAYLQTATEKVGLILDMQSTSMNNLVQLYHTDITEARAGQMAGLKIFLEQNYQNSQYIKEGFANVSNALFQMQSIMSASSAMSTEKAIQTYLGSFRSAGGSAGQNIAEAIGKLGSGNFDLGNMQNLLVMAAAQSGLSYADLLTGGLNSQNSEKLMQGLFSYIANMRNMAGGSNVAMNAIANIFGISVSDIMAAQNMGLGTNGLNTNWDSSIGTFFNNFSDSTNLSTKLDNWLDNAISSQALDWSNGTGTVGWGIFKTLANWIGNKTGGIAQLAGTGMKLAGLLSGNPLLRGGGSLLKAFGNVAKSEDGLPGLYLAGSILVDALGKNGISGAISLDSLLNGTLIPDILTGLGFGDSALSDYLTLGGINGATQWTSSGSTGSNRGVNKSFKLSNGSTGGSSVTIEGEMPSEKTLEDLYNLLADDFPITTFDTATSIKKEYGGNEVLIGNAQNTQYISDMLTITAVSTENILMLLENVFAGGSRTLIDTSSIRLENRWGDLFGSAAR